MTTTATPRRAAWPAARRAAAAFTLIELMVATGILTILVLMVGSLFSQASSIWDSGYVRAEGGMAGRSIVGAIKRDMQTAVDGRAFDGLGFGNDPVKSSGGTVEFVALKPVSPEKRKKGDSGVRKITYSVSRGSVTRKEELVTANGTDSSTGRASWRTSDSESTQIFKSAAAGGTSSFSVKDISVEVHDGAYQSDERKSFEQTGHSEFNGHVAWGRGKPAWARVRVEIVASGATTGLEVRSKGGARDSDSESRKNSKAVVAR